jgi:hypothetical protein
MSVCTVTEQLYDHTVEKHSLAPHVVSKVLIPFPRRLVRISVIFFRDTFRVFGHTISPAYRNRGEEEKEPSPPPWRQSAALHNS